MKKFVSIMLAIVLVATLALSVGVPQASAAKKHKHSYTTAKKYTKINEKQHGRLKKCKKCSYKTYLNKAAHKKSKIIKKWYTTKAISSGVTPNYNSSGNGSNSSYSYSTSTGQSISFPAGSSGNNVGTSVGFSGVKYTTHYKYKCNTCGKTWERTVSGKK